MNHGPRAIFTCALLALSVIGAPAATGQEEPCPAQAAANELAAAGDFAAAAAQLERHLGQSPAHRECRLLLVGILEYDGRAEDACRALGEGLDGSEADLDQLWLLGGFHLELAARGAGYSVRRGMASHNLDVDPAEDEAYRTDHRRAAVDACDRALRIRPGVPAFGLRKGEALLLLGEHEQAVALARGLRDAQPYEVAFALLLTRALDAAGRPDEAAAAGEEALRLDPRSAEAHATLAEYHAERGDNQRADDHRRRAAFFEWLPGFCTAGFTAENEATVRLLAGPGYPGNDGQAVPGPERVAEIERLLERATDRDLQFLAALCWHHGDHGDAEERAFAALAAHPDAGIPLLVSLLDEGESTCTKKQAAHALAGLKVAGVFEPLAELLLRDTDGMFPMDIAGALARLGDPRAVPLLIDAADVRRHRQPPDDDLAFLMDGTQAARCRAIIALGAFTSEAAAVAAELTAGLANPQVSGACHAGLYRLTGDAGHLAALERQLAAAEDGFPADLLMALAICPRDDLRALAEKAFADRYGEQE